MDINYDYGEEEKRTDKPRDGCKWLQELVRGETEQREEESDVGGEAKEEGEPVDGVRPGETTH